jgi:hypothetical protein
MILKAGNMSALAAQELVFEPTPDGWRREISDQDQIRRLRRENEILKTYVNMTAEQFAENMAILWHVDNPKDAYMLDKLYAAEGGRDAAVERERGLRVLLAEARKWIGTRRRCPGRLTKAIDEALGNR